MHLRYDVLELLAIIRMRPVFVFDYGDGIGIVGVRSPSKTVKHHQPVSRRLNNILVYMFMGFFGVNSSYAIVAVRLLITLYHSNTIFAFFFIYYLIVINIIKIMRERDANSTEK